LIREAQIEKARLLELTRRIETLRGLEDREYWDRRYEIEKEFTPLPHKATVNDNLKVARRILKDEYL
jgi:hypothetical protein